MARRRPARRRRPAPVVARIVALVPRRLHRVALFLRREIRDPGRAAQLRLRVRELAVVLDAAALQEVLAHLRPHLVRVDVALRRQRVARVPARCSNRVRSRSLLRRRSAGDAGSSNAPRISPNGLRLSEFCDGRPDLGRTSTASADVCSVGVLWRRPPEGQSKTMSVGAVLSKHIAKPGVLRPSSRRT